MPTQLSPTIHSRLACRGCCSLLLALIFLGMSSQVIAADSRAVSFDVAAGDAGVTLKEFAKQAGLEILYAVDAVRGIRTAAVKGEFTPLDAVRLSLEGTGLVVKQDEQTGALAVNRPRATQNPNGQSGTTETMPDELGQTVVLETFVVSGVRGSIAKGLQIKREANVIVDAVNAEDILVYPDSNIAESLQRISGVTINRTNGEGELVSIRGLSPQFTLVTTQGLSLASTAINDDGNVQNGRAISFDIFPSQLFVEATVAKTLAAETMDGGLSGVVDLALPQPLSYQPHTAAISLQGAFNDLTEEWEPAGTFFYSNRWDNKFGLLVQGVHTEDLLYAGISEGTRWNAFNFPGLNASNVEVARLPRVGEEIYDRTRQAISTTLQFQPSDRLLITAFGILATSKKDRSRVTLQGNLFGPVNPTSLTLEGNQAIAATFGAGTQIRSGGDFNSVDTDSSLLGITSEWFLDSDTKISAKASASSSEFDRSVVATVAQATVNNFSYDFRPNPEYPVMSSTAIDFSNPSAYSIIQNRVTRDVQKDDATMIQFAAEHPLRRGLITQLKAGIEFRTLERVRDTTQGNLPIPAGIASFTSVAGLPRFSYLPNAPQGVPMTFAAFDRDLTYTKLIDPHSSTVLPVLPSLTFGIEEEILASFFQMDFATEVANRRVTGNLGLRYARTRQNARGFSAQGALSTPVAFDRTYDNFLPSLNIRAALNETMVLRLSASRGITRPSLSDLAPSETVSAVNPTVTKGNPNLKPYLATQVDLSWEWYFKEESLFSLAVFNKEIDSLIVTKAVVEHYVPYDPNRPAGDFIITTPVNGDKATVTGFEANYQQPFTFLPSPLDGFGVLANVTVATSSSTSTVVTNTTTGITREVTTRVQGQSPVSYNAILYYDKGPLQVRFAYHWRDDYLILLLGETEQRYKRATGNLDMSFHWRVTDRLTLFMEALNLTSEDSYLYDRTESRNQAFADYGRSITFGARMKF